MKYEVIWSDFAEQQLDLIYEYYKSEAGDQVAFKWIKSIINHTDILKLNPEVGAVEALLKHKPAQYRSLIFKKYKIIYSIDFKTNKIKIADVFDVRQYPLKVVRKK